MNIAKIELLHTEIQELQNQLSIPDSRIIDIYAVIEDLREQYMEDGKK